MASKHLAVLLVITLLAGGCGSGRDAGPEQAVSARSGAGRLTARPGPAAGDCKPGLHELSLPGGDRALLRVGQGAAGRPRPLVLALHGAGGTPRNALWAFRGAYDEPVVLLARAAGDDGWSLSRSSRDVARIDRALAEAFDRCRIDREHVAIGGFSAGAYYALSLGLVNGGFVSSSSGYLCRISAEFEHATRHGRDVGTLLVRPARSTRAGPQGRRFLRIPSRLCRRLVCSKRTTGSSSP